MTSIFDKARQFKSKNVNQQLPDSISTPELNSNQSIFEKARQLPIQKQQPIHPENENDVDREIERNIARQTSQGFSTALGLPGDIEHFARYLIGSEKENILPTSEKIQEGIENLGQGYLTPKNEFEKQTDDFLKDIYSFSIGGPASISRNIGIPLLAKGAEWGLGKMDVTEKNKAYGKAGTMFLLDLLHRRVTNGGAKKYAGALFEESKAAIPRGATHDVANLEHNLFNLGKELKSGGSSPSKNSALTKVEEILSKIKNGRIEVQELVDFRKTLNELIESGGGFEYIPKKGVAEKAVHNLNNVKKDVIEALNDYGKINKRFGKLNSNANEAFAAYSASNKASNYIKKKFGDKIESQTLKILLGLAAPAGLGGGLYLFPTATAGALASLPIYQSYKIFERIKNSPVLRKHYSEILTGAIKQNAAQVSNNISAFEKALKKEEQKQKKRILELKRASDDKK